MRQGSADPPSVPTPMDVSGGGAVATDAAKAAEKAAASIQKRATPGAMPIRQYLESTVVPLLMQGLQALCKERPENPVEYLAHYLLQHNPQKAAPSGGGDGGGGSAGGAALQQQPAAAAAAAAAPGGGQSAAAAPAPAPAPAP